MTAELQYWTQQLRGSPSLVELPTDRPRLAEPRYSGARLTFQLPASLHACLEAMHHDGAASLFATLLAAFQTLLHRYSGQVDILVGTPATTVDMLVLRTDLSGDPSFRTLVQRVRVAELAAYAHAHVPFDAPLVQVLFALQTAPEQPVPSRIDLALIMTEHADGLRGTFEYNTRLFDEPTIARMTGHLERLLVAVVSDPNARISTLTLLSEAERARVVSEWNDSARPYPRKLAHELIADQARRDPDHPALIGPAGELSYRELDRNANALAHELAARGVGPDVVVGILLERSATMVISMLAILKAGGAYLPLDPTYPTDRLELMAKDAKLRLIVTQPRLVPRWAGDIAVLNVEEHEAAISRGAADPPRSGAVPENLAYVIYTSGSTGTPKGVMVAHASLVNLVTAQNEVLQVGPSNRVMQAASFSFDASVWEIFNTLASGATLCLPPPGVLLVGDALAELIVERDVDWALLSPSALSGLPSDALASVKTLATGGEAFTADLVLRWARGRRFVNFYGPTEGTVIATTADCVPDGMPPPLGRPVKNMRVYVLDGKLEPVPIGVAGELHIAGTGIARGYLGRPGLTAERFIPNPFSAGRLYKTGDLGRWLPDGSLTYLGRIDNQVKIRGFRIELGEIEVLLRGHPGVREAAVVVREDSPGDKRLIAYVVGTAQPPVVTELRAAVKRALPESMMPAAFVILAALPLTPNGKLDRRALPYPEWGTAETTYVAPRSALEASLSRIWCDLLGLERLGVDDNFFEHGGQSLIATVFLARVRDAFNTTLPMRVVFERPTVASLAAELRARADDGERIDRVAAALMTVQSATQPTMHRGELGLSLQSRDLRDAMQRAAGAAVQPLARRASTSEDAPTSSGQQSMYFVEQMFAGAGTRPCNEVVAFDVRGTLDYARLQRALTELVERHEVLRTTFHMQGGKLVQRVAAPYEPELAIQDLGQVSVDSHRAEIGRVAFAEVRKPFDLERGPLLRANVLQFSTTEHVVLITIHHITSDDWSIQLFCSDLGASYSADAPLAPREDSRSYADYAELEQSWLSSDQARVQLEFWTGLLETVPHALELPTDRPRPKVLAMEGARRDFMIPRESEHSLARLAREENASLFMALLAVFGAQLGGYAHQDALLIGCPISNRQRPGVQDMMGYFTNTLPVPISLRDTPTFRELVRRVRDVSFDVHANQELPLAHLLRGSRFRRDGNRNPLFQVYFALQHKPTLQLADATVDIFMPPTGRALFELSLEITPEPAGLGAVLEYSTALFSSERAGKLEADFLALAATAAAFPDRPVRLP